MKKHREYYILFNVSDRVQALQHIVEVAARYILIKRDGAVPEPDDQYFMEFPIRDLVALIPFDEFKETLEYVREKGMKGDPMALVLREYLLKEYREKMRKIRLMERMMEQGVKE